MYQGYRSSLSRAPSAPKNEDDIFLMRRSAWRTQGILMAPVKDKRLDAEDKIIVRALGEKLYGSLRPAKDESLDHLAHRTWREQVVLMVRPSDSRLTWPEQMLVRQIGEKLYGQGGQGQ